jgi:hypothetical protein
MTSSPVRTKRQQGTARLMREQLNTSLEHLYQAYSTLHILVLRDDLGEVRSTRQLMETQQLCWKVYDVWIAGAMLLTGMQQADLPAQLSNEPEKEGR